MNAFAHLRNKCLLAALAVWGGGCFTNISCGADESLPPSASGALAAAKDWVAEIDAGKYEQSYDEGCVALHNKVAHDEWLTVLKALRPSLGPLVSRKVASTNYKPDGYEGLQGECVVIAYNTVFAKMPSELEVVVMKREDGKWLGAGYNAQPQQAVQEDQPPPQASTTTQQQDQQH